MSGTPETDAFFAEWTRTDGVLARSRLFAEKLERERDEAREKIKRQAERICQLEGATNHAGGTPLSIALRERDEAREIAGRLAHFLERPAYSVDEAIARMEALNCYKKQKSQ